MARARNIKPGFFTNEDLVELPFEVRLLFVGLWTLADRAGRLEDRPKRIKMAIFPADDVDVDAGLSALADAGFIVRYARAGGSFIAITTWSKHQNPHHREPESAIPAPDSWADPVPEPDKPEASPRPARGEPEASRADSGFRIPDSGLLASGEARAHTREGRPESRRDDTHPPPPFDVLATPGTVNRDAWADWVEHRRRRRKPVSERAAREQWRILSGLSPPQQAACIAHSIRNDYQGLFPEKFTDEPDRPERNPSADRSAAGRVRANVARDRAARAAAAADGNGVAAHELDVRPPLDVEFRRCS